MDALTVPCKFPGILYAFPPTVLIPRVLEKLRREKAVVLLIAPRWPKQAWQADLLSMSATHALQLDKFIHQSPRIFNFHAWMLSSEDINQEDILRLLPNTWLQLCGPILPKYTTQSGKSTRFGAKIERKVRSVPWYATSRVFLLSLRRYRT